MLKQFLAFTGDEYYPGMGMEDFVGDYDTKEEAIEAAASSVKNIGGWNDSWDYKWGLVWDSETRSRVWINE